MSRKHCVCEWCGRHFRRKIGKRNQGLYCSVACASALRSIKAQLEATLYEWRTRAPHISRALIPLAPRACVGCGAPLTRKQLYRRAATTCSRRCLNQQQRGKRLPRRTFDRVCTVCASPFVAKQSTRTVCRRCARRAGRVPGSPMARARHYGVERDGSVNRIAVFERDGWRCQLCGRSTYRWRHLITHARAPELDHIVPISQGGGHTWHNVQCTCRACNQAKANRTAGQFRLPLDHHVQLCAGVSTSG